MPNGVRRLRCLVAIACALASGTPSLAATNAGVGINARVPTVCTAELSLTQISMEGPGSRITGSLEELCNSVDGYRLVLSHPRGVQGAEVDLDGTSVPISAEATKTVLIDTNQPGYVTREFALIFAEREDIIPMSIYAEPKGRAF